MSGPYKCTAIDGPCEGEQWEQDDTLALVTRVKNGVHHQYRWLGGVGNNLNYGLQPRHGISRNDGVINCARCGHPIKPGASRFNRQEGIVCALCDCANAPQEPPA